jgi:hypothetical protein
VGFIHFTAATLLFVSFIFFCLVLFRKTDGAQTGPLPLAKARRNKIYVACGIAIIACLVWAGIAKMSGGSIFWPETWALEAFAFSWLTKGRADDTARAALRAALRPARAARRMLSLGGKS